MELNNKDFIIYSSHKTSTQTIIKSLRNNGFKCEFCHLLNTFKIKNEYKDLNDKELKKIFISKIKNYKFKNNKKIKIITCIRNPIDRLPSSYFQTNYNDYIHFLNYEPNDTPIMKNSIEELLKDFTNGLKNYLEGSKESLDEISEIFDIDIIKNCEKREKYYYHENNLIELYILDFNEIITNGVEYLNNIFNLELTDLTCNNLSSEKQYYEKYKEFKKNITPEIKDIIKSKYNEFYFNCFE